MSTWEERMSQRAQERQVVTDDGLTLAEFKQKTWDELPPELKNPEPPDDGTCRECYEWRRFPVGQEHFGYAWWRTCSRMGVTRGCEHAHHDDEIWIASAG